MAQADAPALAAASTAGDGGEPRGPLATWSWSDLVAVTAAPFGVARHR